MKIPNLLFVALLPLVAISAPAFAEETPQLANQGFTSAKICRQCHVAIYEGWKDSMHANAISDPVFHTIFLETSQETGGKSEALCLSCHSPTTRITKDLQLKDPLSQEGVTCDFCHSIRNVNLGAPASKDTLDVAPGKIKYGPLKNVTSPAHETAYSENHEKADLCGACHNFTNERGVPIFETYSEWTKSPQAKDGVTCQTCHMPKIGGLVVPLKVKPTNEVYINSHEAAGGHFAEQVKKAVTTKIVETTRTGDKLHVVVRLENVGSGHKVPTGIPTRKVVLQLQATAGGASVFTEERTYQKVLANEKGEAITRDSDLFLHASKIISDNRLEPRKPRDEHFTFLVPEGKSVEVETLLYYSYQPRLIQETEMRVDLGRQKAVVPAP